MKKLLLLFSFVFTLSAKAQTNVYHPFPDSNVVWNIEYGFACSTSAFESRFYSYLITNDTIIGIQIYHQLWTPAEIINSHCNQSGVNPGWYSGAIRQDIPNKKIYFIAPNDSIEKLLYDFNLSVGDSLNSFVTEFCNGLKIIAIDSVLIGNTYRKRFEFDQWATYMIEGIGGTNGLLEPLCRAIDAGWILSCFQQNGKTLYPDSTTSCNVILSVNNIPEKNISITLLPNPIHSTATLEIKNKEFSNAELKIYDGIGRLVQRQKINNLTTTIHRNSLADGIYFYQLVSDGDKTTSGKFVVN